MNRRTLLRRTAIFAPLGLAGCLGDGDAATPTPSPTPGIDGTAIETTDTSCGPNDPGVASLSADAGRHEVTVTGTVEAPNPCHLAELVATELAEGTLSLTVGVARDDGDGCTECIGAIDYRATVRLATGGETTVVVSHETANETTEVQRETVQF